MTVDAYLAGLRRHDLAHHAVCTKAAWCAEAAPHPAAANQDAASEREAVARFVGEARRALGQHAAYTASWWETCGVPISGDEAGTGDPLADLARRQKERPLEVSLAALAPADYRALLAMPLSEAMPYLSLRALGQRLDERDAPSI